MTDTTRLRGALFALGATVIWSGNFIVARLLNQSIEPATLSLLRWGVALAGFVAYEGCSIRGAVRGNAAIWWARQRPPLMSDTR